MTSPLRPVIAKMSAKKLLNAEDDVVEEMICGILACHPTLTRLEGSVLVHESRSSVTNLISLRPMPMTEWF